MKYIISALTPEQLTYSSEKTAQQAEIIAVSYTPLDVYKRQVYDSPHEVSPFRY